MVWQREPVSLGWNRSAPVSEHRVGDTCCYHSHSSPTISHLRLESCSLGVKCLGFVQNCTEYAPTVTVYWLVALTINIQDGERLSVSFVRFNLKHFRRLPWWRWKYLWWGRWTNIWQNFEMFPGFLSTGRNKKLWCFTQDSNLKYLILEQTRTKLQHSRSVPCPLWSGPWSFKL